ncbi:hemagglutinin repeat-containing protein [Rhizobium sp. BK602]|uniref:hemagglutinin repeat-containing protein n=1 Tax=Rhizobium sp. BK602 TaxID=2586986 RepID=UPI0032B17C2E
MNLNAATGTSDTTSTNTSWSAGIGVNLGCSTASTKCETSVGVSGSYGKGSATRKALAAPIQMSTEPVTSPSLPTIWRCVARPLLATRSPLTSRT